MSVFVLVTHHGQRTDGYWSSLPHPSKCCSLLAGLRCPRAARHSTAWCKWRALCKWSNIFATSVLGSHTTFLFHPSDSLFSNHCLKHIHLYYQRLYSFKVSTVFFLKLFSPCRLNHGLHIPFHIFLSLSWYKREIITKFQLWNVCQIPHS